MSHAAAISSYSHRSAIKLMEKIPENVELHLDRPSLFVQDTDVGLAQAHATDIGYYFSATTHLA